MKLFLNILFPFPRYNDGWILIIFWERESNITFIQKWMEINTYNLNFLPQSRDWINTVILLCFFFFRYSLFFSFLYFSLLFSPSSPFIPFFPLFLFFSPFSFPFSTFFSFFFFLFSVSFFPFYHFLFFMNSLPLPPPKGWGDRESKIILPWWT